MPQNWKTYMLNEVAQVIDSLHKTPEYSEDGYPMVRAQEITGGVLSLSDTAKVSEKVYLDFSKNHKSGPGDLVYSRVGAHCGKVSYVKTDIPFCLGQNTVFILPKNVENKFLYYFLDSPISKDQIERNAVVSSYKTISLKTIRELEINLPPLPEQRAIASILTALDDKIELNLQMNKTLEEMAMTLYKHWFVDFGPFQNGKFVESELGMIPEGWEVKRLDEFLTVKRGGSPRPIRDFMAEEGYPWLKISDATASISPFLYSTKEFIKKEGLRKTVLMKPGSIILSNSATPGLPRLLEFETCIHDGWLHFPEIKRLNRYILYLLFLDIKAHLIQQGNGSVFTNLKTDILKSQMFNLPPIEIESEFSNIITPWFEKIKMNTEENLTLSKKRDTLLPKLISGEVRVKQAEEIIKSIT
ncbi:restriction endonuclease subunit S [Crocinitomix catalasitica]|uniref:restriction endonuclease subunit S n=1 Tax=Crocinitomix catalasitica TaxID=184607 RepID=UPI0004864DCB|nr:restriction endonuclease subunit S [Crocinitomix catalasitica]